MGQGAKTKKFKFLLPILLLVALAAAAWWYLSNHTVAVLEPAGIVGQKEKHLMMVSVLLALIIVVPVFTMAIFIASRYREGNRRPKKYNPDWDHQNSIEFTWWAVPIIIITILSVITWNSSHELDPYKALAASKPAMKVQVISLNWKWLFIYPDQNIASVNFAQIPINTPVDFEITSDSVMNSFWVPQLGSQIYSMPGMATQLNLMADKAGDFYGSSANISGRGFASMNFTVRSSSEPDFNKWVGVARGSSKTLDQNNYEKLAEPSQNNPVTYYSPIDSTLFDNVTMKYMMSSNGMPDMMSGMGMQGMGM